jgi:hypothetical protein
MPPPGGAPLAPAPASVPVVAQAIHYDRLTPEQHSRIQEDLAERERQASALAAAGMVADSVSLTRPSTVIGQVLQAPPPLVGIPPPLVMPPAASGSSTAGPPLESMNWNFDLGGSALGAGVDDMDVEFATLFDSEEEQSLLMQGMMAPSPMTVSTSPAPTSTETHGTPNPLNASHQV